MRAAAPGGEEALQPAADEALPGPGQAAALTLVRSLAASAAAIAVLLLTLPPAASAQGLALKQIGGQSFHQPLYVTGAPGDPSRVFVVEAPGTVRLIKSGITQPTPFLDISDDVLDIDQGCGECGLLSIAPAPDYQQSGLLYAFYTRDKSPGHHDLVIEELRRMPGDPDRADPASRRVVLEIPHEDFADHNGGQLQFGPDGLLYISVGDGGGRGDPLGSGQDLETLLGKLLRIDPAGAGPGDYSIPPGNPFAAGPGEDEIYSYGLRNPWRFSFDLATGDLTIGDVGQSAWEEVDFVPRGAGSGANFGWSCFEGHAVFPPGCEAPGHVPPVLVYPNPATRPAAVAGGYVVRDGALPSLFGRYVYADTYEGVIRSAVLFPGGSSGGGSVGLPQVPLITSFGQDACAHVYVASLHGPVYRVEPSSGPFPCTPLRPLDRRPPRLALWHRLARHAARRRAVVLLARCDERCRLRARGFIAVRGGDRFRLRLRGSRRQIGPAVTRRLRLGLRPRQRRRLARALRDGGRAVARVRVTATDAAGNSRVVRRAIRQRR